MSIQQIVTFAKEGRVIGADGVKALAEEVERLHKWADSFSDSQLEERRTGELYQREQQAEINRLTSLLTSVQEERDALASELRWWGHQIAGGFPMRGGAAIKPAITRWYDKTLGMLYKDGVQIHALPVSERKGDKG